MATLYTFYEHSKVSKIYKGFSFFFNEVRQGIFFFFLLVCFTSYFVFSIAVLPHSPGVVYYHLLLGRETRIPGVASFSFQIEIWDLFVQGTEILYTHSLWEVVDHSRSKMTHHNSRPWYETRPRIELGTFGLADECSTTELTLLLKN